MPTANEGESRRRLPSASTLVKPGHGPSVRDLVGRRLLGKRSRSDSAAAYGFIVPALLVYIAFFLWPFAQLVILSFQRWDGLGEKEWVGFNNYLRLVDDSLFWLSLQHNLLWMLAAVIVPVLAGLLLAILLYRSPLRGKMLFRTIYFLPQVLSSVVIAIIWRWIYNPDFGALNTILGALGLDSLQRAWLGEPNLALPALFIGWTWVHYGFTMVIFLAALQGIDEEYFDAAKIDGANWLQQFQHILVPFIKGPLSVVVLITAISAFQVFDLVFILTRGGPGRATMILSIYMYEMAFSFDRIGAGAAIAIILGLLVLAFSVVFLWIRGELGEER